MEIWANKVLKVRDAIVKHGNKKLEQEEIRAEEGEINQRNQLQFCAAFVERCE